MTSISFITVSYEGMYVVPKAIRITLSYSLIKFMYSSVSFSSTNLGFSLELYEDIGKIKSVFYGIYVGSDKPIMPEPNIN